MSTARFRMIIPDDGTFPTRLNNLLAKRRIPVIKLTEDDVCAIGTAKKWLNGTSLPNAYILKKLVEYFDVSADYLLGTEKTAEWKFVEGECRCSQCGNRGETIFPFCPYCGKRMDFNE